MNLGLDRGSPVSLIPPQRNSATGHGNAQTGLTACRLMFPAGAVIRNMANDVFSLP